MHRMKPLESPDKKPNIIILYMTKMRFYLIGKAWFTDLGKTNSLSFEREKKIIDKTLSPMEPSQINESLGVNN